MQDGTSEELTEVTFRRTRFAFDEPSATFAPIAYPDAESVRSYLTSAGFASDEAALAALEKWGPNTVDVPAPSFMEMLKEQMIAPFFVFQARAALHDCAERDCLA